MPILPLDKRLPAISDLYGVRVNAILCIEYIFIITTMFMFCLFHCNLQETVTFLDIAEALVGESSGAETVRVIIAIYKTLKTLSELFESSNEDGILIAGNCIFKPNQERQCEGGLA